MKNTSTINSNEIKKKHLSETLKKKEKNKNDYIESLIEAHKKGPHYTQIISKKKL